ncbi:MAG TPA: GNAT family N-acetyltransferase [Stellaceae bacterium]|jgi:GNAT superfamily N-acetyltransferase|nr:GNAT family N-acetyltransferase [Stellaceae bacterium]
MLRRAVETDVPRIREIRDGVRENILSDPSRVTAADIAWFLNNGPIWVWQEPDGTVAGFSAGDPRDGWIWALFVAPGCEGKGIGRALLKAACDRLLEAGHKVATLSAEPGTRAERHYRAAGWTATGFSERGEIVFQKSL